MHFAKAKFRDKANNEDGFVFSQGGSVEGIDNIESISLELNSLTVPDSLKDSTEEYNSFLNSSNTLTATGQYSGVEIKKTTDGNFSTFSQGYDNITFREHSYLDNSLPKEENPGYIESEHADMFFQTSSLHTIDYSYEFIDLRDYEFISHHYNTIENFATKWSQTLEPRFMGNSGDDVSKIVKEITLKFNISLEEAGGYDGTWWEIIFEKNENASLVLEQRSGDFFWSSYKHKQTSVTNSLGTESAAFFEGNERIAVLDIQTTKVNHMQTVSGILFRQDLSRNYSPPAGTPFGNIYHPPVNLIKDFEVNAIKAEFGSEIFGLAKLRFWSEAEIVFDPIENIDDIFGYILDFNSPNWVTGEYLKVTPVPRQMRSKEGITLTYSRQEIGDNIPGHELWRYMINKATLTIPPGVTGFMYEPGDHDIITWSIVPSENTGKVLTNEEQNLELSFTTTSSTLTYDGYYDIEMGGSGELIEQNKENITFSGATAQGEIGRLNNEITRWTTTEHVDQLPTTIFEVKETDYVPEYEPVYEYTIRMHVKEYLLKTFSRKIERFYDNNINGEINSSVWAKSEEFDEVEQEYLIQDGYSHYYAVYIKRNITKLHYPENTSTKHTQHAVYISVERINSDTAWQAIDQEYNGTQEAEVFGDKFDLMHAPWETDGWDTGTGLTYEEKKRKCARFVDEVGQAEVPLSYEEKYAYPSNVKQVTNEVHTVMLELAKGDQITVNVASFNLGGLSNLASFDAIDIYDRTDVILAIGDANLNGIWEKDDLESTEGYQTASVTNLNSSDTISYTSRNAAKNSHGFRLGNNIYAKQLSLFGETSLYLGDNTTDPFNSADPLFWDNLTTESEVNIYPPQGYLTKTDKSDRIENYSKNNLGEIDKIYIDGLKYLSSPKRHQKLKSIQFIEVSNVVEQIEISIEINGVVSSHTFSYQYTGHSPKTDKATGKKFYSIYSSTFDGTKKYLISKLSRNLEYPFFSGDINDYEPDSYYFIGLNSSEEGAGVSSEWYIPDIYKTFERDTTEYTAVGSINVVSLEGKFASEYKAFIGNYEQKLDIDYNEGVQVTELINDCTFTTDENNYVTAIHHSGYNFYDIPSSGLAGGETAKGQFYKTYRSGTTVGEIAVTVNSVDGTYFVESIVWTKPTSETVTVLSQTAKGKNGINTLNLISLEGFSLLQEDIDFSSNYFTAKITKGLTRESAYIANNGLAYDVPLGSRIENGKIGKVDTESTTRIIEPFDKDLGYYPNKIDLSNLVLGDWNYSEGVSDLQKSTNTYSDNLEVDLSNEYFQKNPVARIIDPTFKEGLTHWNTDNNFGEIPFQTTLGNIRISTTPKLAGFAFEPTFINGDGTNLSAVIGEQDSEEGLIIGRLGTLPSRFFYERPLPAFDPNSSFDYTSRLSRMGNLINHSLVENVDIEWDSAENKHKFTIILNYPDLHYLLDINGGFLDQDKFNKKIYTVPKSINHLHLAAGSTYKFKNQTFSPTFWLNNTEVNGGTEISTTQDSEYTTLTLPYDTYKDVEKIYYNIGDQWGELPVSSPIFNDYMGANVGIFYNQLKLAVSRRNQKTNKALYINDCYALTDWTNYTSSAHDLFFLQNLTQSLGISLELPPVSEGAMYVTWNDIKNDWIAGVMSDDRKWHILKHTMFDPRDYFKGLDNQGEVKSVSHWYNHFNQYDCVIWNARALQKEGQPIHPNFIQALLLYRKNGGGIIFNSGDLGYSHFWRKHVSPHFGIAHVADTSVFNFSGYGSRFVPTNNNWENGGWVADKGVYPAAAFLPEQPFGYFGQQVFENLSLNSAWSVDLHNPSIEPLNTISGNNEGGIYQNIATVPNEVYDIEFEIENAIGGSTAVYIDDVLQTEKFNTGDFKFTYSFKATKDITKLEVKSRGEDYVYREIKSIKSKAEAKELGTYKLIPQEDAIKQTNTCSVLGEQLFDKYYLTKEGLTKHIINSEVGTSLEVMQLNPEGTTVNGVEIPYIEKISIFKRVGDPLPEKYLYDEETKTLSLYVRPQDCEEVGSQDSLHYDLRYVSYLIESWFNYTTTINIDDHIEFVYKRAEFSQKDKNILNKKYADVYPDLSSPYFNNTDLITGSIRVLDYDLDSANSYGFNSTRMNSYYHRLSKYDIWLPAHDSDFSVLEDASQIPTTYPNDLFGESFESTNASYYWPSLLLNKCLGEIAGHSASTYQGAPGDSVFAWEAFASGHLGFKESESDHFHCLKNPYSCGLSNVSVPSMTIDGVAVSDGQEVFCTKNEWTSVVDTWASFNNFKDRYPTFYKNAYLIKYFPHYHPVGSWKDEHKNIDFINKDSSIAVSYYYNNEYYIVNEPIPLLENLEKNISSKQEVFCSTNDEGITVFSDENNIDFIKSAAVESAIKTTYHTDDRSFVVQDKIEPQLRLGVLQKGYKSPKYYPEQSIDPVIVDKSKYFYFQLFSDDVTEFDKVKFALVYVDESTQTEQSFGIHVFPKPVDPENNYKLGFFSAYGIQSEQLRRVALVLHHNKKYYPKLTENGNLPDYTNSQIFYDRN